MKHRNNQDEITTCVNCVHSQNINQMAIERRLRKIKAPLCFFKMNRDHDNSEYYCLLGKSEKSLGCRCWAQKGLFLLENRNELRIDFVDKIGRQSGQNARGSELRPFVVNVLQEQKYHSS